MGSQESDNANSQEPIVISDESEADIHDVKDVRDLLSDVGDDPKHHESIDDSISGSSSPLLNLLKHSKSKREIPRVIESKVEKGNTTHDGVRMKSPSQPPSQQQGTNDIINIDSDEIEAAKSNSNSPNVYDHKLEFQLNDLSNKRSLEIISIDNTLDSIQESDFNWDEQVVKKPKLSPNPSNRQEQLKAINDKYGASKLREVNKVSRKKEELLAEMIMYIPKTLHERFEAETIEFQDLNLEIAHGNDSEISWKRQVNATYDEANDIFIPCDPQTINESITVTYYQAEEFFKKLSSINLNNCYQVSKSIPFISHNTIIMIEGYHQYLTKINNLENKQFKQKVLDTNKTPIEVSYTVKDFEKMINKLQFMNNINIYPVKNLVDARDWLSSFTYTIAFGKYDKFERNPEFANLINIKSGNDYKTTFIETIHKFKLMPYTRCERLYLYYDNLKAIAERYKANNTLGKDNHGKNLIPETTELGMKNFFNSDNADEIFYS